MKIVRLVTLGLFLGYTALGRGRQRAGAGGNPAIGRARRAGGDHHGPVGDCAYLRRHRGGSVLRPGVQRGARSVVPVRVVAPQGDRHDRGDPRPTDASGRRWLEAVPLRRRSHAGTEPLPPARRGHRPGIRTRDQRLHRSHRAAARIAPDRVRPARDHAGSVDHGGRDFTPPGPPLQSDPRARVRARGRPGGRRDRSASCPGSGRESPTWGSTRPSTDRS